MKSIYSKFPAIAVAGISLLGITALAYADGMKPESPLVIINVDKGRGETTMRVKNTDGEAALLHTNVYDIPEDTETVVVVTPPVARVEAGQQQQVRFMYQGEDLQTQRLKRVSFDSIGQAKSTPGQATVALSVRQDIPLLLHPASLPKNAKPWELLQWSLQGNQLTVHNDSAYVVRLETEVTLLPSGTKASLPKSYLLPGEKHAVASAAGATTDDRVEIKPATVYGFSVKAYEAPLK